MAKRRPRLSLDLLKGFEAAARHLSFTRAAQELSLTQSAISREVKTLEEQLGQPLFSRGNRGLRLTDAGQALQRAVGEALKLIDEATDRLGKAGGAQALTVTTSVPLASLWLAPRLPRFTARHADVDVRIAASNRALDLVRERIDLALRWFAAGTAPPSAPWLMAMEVLPVCAPALLRDRTRPLRSPDDLTHRVLLEYEPATVNPTWLDWAGWFRALKLAQPRPTGMLRFSHYDQVIEAATKSAGVALGRFPHLMRHLREGLLVAPFGRRAVVDLGAWHLVTAPAAGERAVVKEFVAWLQEEARRDAEVGAPSAAGPGGRSRWNRRRAGRANPGT
jgi:DNA-binding transcriptional LysR family regulator